MVEFLVLGPVLLAKHIDLYFSNLVKIGGYFSAETILRAIFKLTLYYVSSAYKLAHAMWFIVVNSACIESIAASNGYIFILYEIELHDFILYF